MKKNIIISSIVTLVSTVVCIVNGIYRELFVLVPTFFVFTYGFINYLKFTSKTHQKIGFKIISIFLNMFLIYGLFQLGYRIWKWNAGNFFHPDVNHFELTFSNIWFWCLYQSTIMLLFLGVFRLIVTIDQKIS